MGTFVSHISWWQRINWRAVGVSTVGLLGIAAVTALVIIGQARAAVALTVAFALVTMAMVRTQWAIAATLVYLIFLADLRRLLILVDGWTTTDPLLMIGPVFAIAIFAYAWASRSVKLDTPLAYWILGLMGIMAIQVFNPKQGGLIVGVGGIMYTMVPVLWFWIGRTYATLPFIRRFFSYILLPLVLLATLVSFYHSLYGYLPYQMEWYYVAGYTALGDLQTGLAPISFFASGTEHVVFLTVGIVVLWAIGLQKNRATLLLIPPLFIAAFITGTRGPIAKLLIVGAGLWAIQGKTMTTWIVRGAVALLIAGVGLVWGLNQATEMSFSDRIENRVQRQAQEFTQRDGKGRSSVGVHLTLLANGYRSALNNPLGYGLGAGSKAAKLGSNLNPSVAHGTETDLGNSFLALGLPGGIVYHIIVFLVVWNSFRYWQQTRSATAMAFLGILGVTFMQWLSGGLYAISPLLWICIGALDRLHRSEYAE